MDANRELLFLKISFILYLIKLEKGGLLCPLKFQALE